MTAREIADDLIIDAGLTTIEKWQVLYIRAIIGNWLRTTVVAFSGEYMEIGLL
jgi:hypothetical protein